jgi:hypothetical protein
MQIPPAWPHRIFGLLLVLAAPLLLSAQGLSLKDALLLHASFDHGLNADHAAGDSTLYWSPDTKRASATPGLPEDGQAVLAKGEGRFGDCLRFTRKGKPIVFFKGEQNLGYKAKDWSGGASFWLRLNPDEDLEPGYCDPVQYVAQAWGEGNMFVEFSKDHTPRHFRYAIMAVTKHWNPNNEKWEEMQHRPMVPVEKPPFRRDQWTHVAFSFGNANTGKKDGWGKLWLNGEYIGEFTGWDNTFNWDVGRSALTLGLNYAGWLDDLAIFNRPLTDADVKAIYQSKSGVAGLVR